MFETFPQRRRKVSGTSRREPQPSGQGSVSVNGDAVVGAEIVAYRDLRPTHAEAR
jgi:hypothetical protein